MMGKEMEEFGDFWLPADFLSDDFFADKISSPGELVAESENDEETVGRLSQQLRFLGLNPKTSVLAKSPQSTLGGIGSWPFSSNGSPEGGSSQGSSPPSTPFPPPRREESLDLLYAYAGQVARLEMNDKIVHQHGSFFCKNHKMGLHTSQAAAIMQQHLQAARFYELKRQQRLKQQWAAQAARHRDEMVPLGLSNSVWPPLQKHHNHQPPFLNGARRESKGTGVFLPRRAGTQAQPEPRKKQACSPVMLPARVVQALNLNIDDVTAHPRVPGAYLLDQDASIARGNSMRAEGKWCPRSAHDLRVPSEWTYCHW